MVDGDRRCRLAPTLLLGALQLLTVLLARATGSSPTLGAKDYLSDDFCPGLAVLEAASPGGPAWRLRVYAGGQAAEAAAALPAELEASGWLTLSAAAESIGSALKLPVLEKHQLPWALFDHQGRAFADLAAFRRAPVAFFLEIGVWVWPPVRVGFEQVIEGVGRGHAVLRTISLRPKVFEVRDFLSANETEEVTRIGQSQTMIASEGQMQSRDRDAGRAHNSFRTSTQAWLPNSLSPLIAELDIRVSQLTRVPASHNEPVQLLRYGEGKYYHAHMDWTELELYPDQQDVWLRTHFGHQDRLATVFWYLNDVGVGGETIFPKHGQAICAPHSHSGPTHCAGSPDHDVKSCDVGLKVRPRRGSVVLWYNYHANGRGDRNSLHAGCPVGPGLVKWSANKWVRIKPGSASAQWDAAHPALRRHGWTGGQAPERPHNFCLIVFANGAGEAADILWKPGPKGEPVALGSVAVGGTSAMNSVQGHLFLLRGRETGRQSADVACAGPRSEASLSHEFELTLKDATGVTEL